MWWIPVLVVIMLGMPVESVDTCPQGYGRLISGNDPVPDSALTATSQKQTNLGPEKARITNSGKGGKFWVPEQEQWKANGGWIQVMFNTLSTVCAIETKGRVATNGWWIKSYEISTSEDCKTFIPYKENGQVKIFTGNNNSDSLVTDYINNPMKTQCLRLIYVDFEKRPALRFDIIGKPEDLCPSDTVPLISGSNPVPNIALTASSQFNRNLGPEKSRITNSGKRGQFWLAGKHQNDGAWIQVRFKQLSTVCAIETKGRVHEHITQWVKTYTISTSEDCKNFTEYKENGQVKIFRGNVDGDSLAIGILNFPADAKCLRLTVDRVKGSAALRFEVVGKQIVAEQILILLDVSESLKSFLSEISGFLQTFFSITSTNEFFQENNRKVTVALFNGGLISGQQWVVDYSLYATAAELRDAETEKINSIIQAIDAREAAGFTNLGQTLQEALVQYELVFDWRVILVSDFININKSPALADLLQQYSNEDIPTFPVLVDKDIRDEDTYNQVKSSGSNYGIDLRNSTTPDDFRALYI